MQAMAGLGLLASPVTAQSPDPASRLASAIGDVPAKVLVDGADGYGPLRDDPPVAAVLRDGETAGWRMSFVIDGAGGRRHVTTATRPLRCEP